MLVCVKCVKWLLLFFLFECMYVGVFVIFVHVSAGLTVEKQVVLQVLQRISLCRVVLMSLL